MERKILELEEKIKIQKQNCKEMLDEVAKLRQFFIQNNEAIIGKLQKKK